MLTLASRSRIALAGVLVLAACGGDGPTDPGDDPGGGGNTTGTRMTATIDGQSWAAGSTAGLVTAIQFAPASGGYIISGIQSPGLSIVITINNISGPGTYPLGVDAATVYGGFAGVTGAGTWNTPISGAAGSITITTLTTTRIVGTFNFTATAAAGGATGSKVVTNGVFDAPIQGNAILPVLKDSMGGKMSATLNGVAWNAGIIAAGTSLGFISISGINNVQTLVFTFPKPTTTGTYAMNNVAGNILLAWDPNAVAPAGARCCYGIAGDVGSMTFTSLTTTRAKGTFIATLRAQPGTAATGQLVITNGSFDVGLYHNP
jgi:hypothetical protein